MFLPILYLCKQHVVLLVTRNDYVIPGRNEKPSDDLSNAKSAIVLNWVVHCKLNVLITTITEEK